MIETILLEQLKAFLYSTRIGGCTEGAQSVMVGNTLEDDLLAIEFHSKLGRELDGADTEGVGHAIHHSTLGIKDSYRGSVEMGRLATPQTGILHYERVGLEFHGAPFAIDGHVLGACIYDCAIGIANNGTHGYLIDAGTSSDLGLNLHDAIVGSSDVERMALKPCGRIGSHKSDIAEESATSVPTGVERLCCMGTHCNDVGRIEAELLGDINLKAHITVVGAANTLAVEVYITNVHDALEVEQEALSLERSIGSVVLDIPSGSHFLECAGRKTALEVGCSITIVGALFG